MAEAQMEANDALTWIKIQTAYAHDMRLAIAEVDRFDGGLGDLVHFIKAGDRITKTIAEKAAAGWIGATTVPELKAALVNRASRRVLNAVQGDESTPWEVLKERLKRVYGGGRWAPEEDALRMIREVKGARQTAGRYASRLLEWYTAIAEKLGESCSTEVAQIKMSFLEDILKAQLKRETTRSIPAEKTFIEAVRELVDEDGREDEEARRAEENRWVEVTPRRSERRWTPPRIRNSGDHQRRGSYGGRREREQHKPPRRERRPEVGPPRRCYECGSDRHLAARCPKKTCYQCGNEGHIARRCPLLYKRDFGGAEPMEINAQRLDRTEKPFAGATRGRRGSADSGDYSERSSDSERTSPSLRRHGARPVKETML